MASSVLLQMQMGNHILDMGSPEMKARQEGGDPVSAWNQTWIWGGLDGQVLQTVVYQKLFQMFLVVHPGAYSHAFGTFVFS